MTRCPACHRDVIAAIRSNGTRLLLDVGAQYKAWVGVDDAHLFPEDGDTVFPCAALIEHGPICPGVQAGQRQARQRRALQEGALAHD